MKTLSRYWNYKLRGIPGAIYLIISIILKSLLDHFFYLLNRGNFQKIKKNTFFHRSLIYRYPQNIQIGENCILNKNIKLESEVDDSFLNIGNNVNIAENVNIDFTGGLIIENNVTISKNVNIFTHDHGLDPRSIPLKKELRIHKNVWIGSNAVILQNVNSIGVNSIIASGSVVTKDVDKNVIVGGNPATLIKNI
jgi:acetyltransferase-like isoleucine patch superfamily enzyme